MWEHPATRQNLATLCDRGVQVEGPEAGELACGWEGLGRMSEPEVIADAVERRVPGSGGFVHAACDQSTDAIRL